MRYLLIIPFPIIIACLLSNGRTPRIFDQVTNTFIVDSVAGSNKAGVNAANQQLVITEGQKATYAAVSVGGFAAATAATDIWAICGSGSKTVRVTHFQYSEQATVGGVDNQVDLLMRSTADTGGTSTLLTNVPYDSNSAAGTATVRSYTANPTLGTLIGSIYEQFYDVTVLTGISQLMTVDFTTRNQQAVVLRGTAQCLCLNKNANTNAGSRVVVNVEWTEE